MRSVVSLITAAALLLHVWLGCCSHHAHAGDGVFCASHQHAVHAHDDHGTHQHNEGPSSDSGPADQCPGNPCDESDCAFAACGKTLLSKTWFAAGVLIAVLPQRDEEPVQQLAAPHWTVDLALSTPVRVHLLYQVLLN